MTASLAIVVLTTMSWLLVMHSYRLLMQQSFRERSLAYVQAFASSSMPWLDPVQPVMLQSAARLMLVGSARYVQIAIDGNLVVDERSESVSDSLLPSIQAGVLTGIQETSAMGASSLDIVVPAFSGEPLSRAYVRIGIDGVSVVLRSRLTALWAAALAVGVDIVLVGLLWWLVGFRVALLSKASSSLDPLETDSGGQTVVGELRIDATGRRMFFKDQQVKLTPKQYALIEFLAREPDRVFTDLEIVSTVWEASTYADSKDVKQYVYLVRRRLAAIHPSGKQLIETVPGFGYKLVSECNDEELTDG
ncbi:winged helix-turn-helix domain-containing protein [Candidatus Bipolaricaulota bacterium]